MKIATWNVNGIRARIENVLFWLRDETPDLVCLQEIKSLDTAFPSALLEELGYNVAVHGQKGFNGVAILSKRPFDEVITQLPGDKQDEQARYLEVVITTDRAAVRVASIYAPNGNPVGSDKFNYKIAWMDRLCAHAENLLAYEEVTLLCGDYNVIPEPEDAHDPEAWREDALFHPESRKRFRTLMGLGYIDAIRSCCYGDRLYTFWNYQAGAWKKNHGIRIDHLLLSPQATDKIAIAKIHAEPRGWKKPSDHVPVSVILE